MSDYKFAHLNLADQPPNFDSVRVASLPDVDKLLITADGTLRHGRRSAVIIGMALMHIVKEGPAIGLRYLEGRYRHLGSNTYLVAAPKRIAPPGTEPRSIRTGKLMNYHLWICVNGQREAEDMMAQFNIRGPEENLARLNETGVLITKKSGGKS